LRVVVREIAGQRERDEIEHDREIRSAWLTVRIYAEWRTKRLPSLKKLLQRTPTTATAKRRGARQTVDEQRAALHQFSRMFGGKVTTHGR